MSVIIAVAAPLAIVEWPLLCATAAGIASSLGYCVLKDAKQTEELEIQQKEMENSVEISLEKSHILGENLARGSSFILQKDDITTVFKRTTDGGCSVHVSGKNKTDQELRAIGDQLVNKITQQYTYNKVITELKKKGFSVDHEELSQDQTIRIQVSKYV